TSERIRAWPGRPCGGFADRSPKFSPPVEWRRLVCATLTPGATTRWVDSSEIAEESPSVLGRPALPCPTETATAVGLPSAYVASAAPDGRVWSPSQRSKPPKCATISRATQIPVAVARSAPEDAR